MRYLKLCAIVLTTALTLTLAGCCCGGTDTETKIIEKQPVSTAPLGEELIKLKEARDKGAMSEQEYEAARKSLLKE
jgi:hypothetical protein